MRILHLGKYYWPYKGGMERFVRDLCQAQARRGHQVVCAVHNHMSTFVEEVMGGVRVIRFAKWAKLWSQPLSLWQPQRLRDCNADVIHIHGPHPLAEMIGVFFLSGRKILTLHALPQGRMQRQIYIYWLKRILNRFNAVTLTSSTYLNSPECSFLKKFPVHIIPLGIDFEYWQQVQSSKRKAKDILFVGRPTHYKGLDILLAAIANTNYGLSIVGQGPNNESKVCQRLLAHQQVEWFPDCSDEDLKSLYQTAKILVLPSTSNAEAFGLCVLEAQSFGLATLSTDLESGLQDLNDGKTTGLTFAPGKSTDLQQKIELLLSNQSLRQSLAKRAQDLVTKKYSLESVLAAYTELYLASDASPS